MPERTTTVTTPMEFVSKYAMTGLLVIAAFVIGVLFTEVRYLKNGGGARTATDTTADGTGAVASTPIEDILADAGFDSNAVMDCYDSNDEAITQRITSQQSGGSQAGVTGTPGNFVVGPDGKGELLAGAYPLAEVKTIIDGYLKDGKTANTTDLTGLPAISDADYSRGPTNARVTIVEYSDFDCPFCNQFHGTMQQVMEDYDGQVRWIYRHYPIDQLHPNATKIAQVSECIAKDEGVEGFWEFADTYFGLKANGTTVTI